MLQKSIPIALFVCWLFAPLTAQEPMRLSLDGAVDYAMQQNLEVKNAQLAVISADQQIIERRAFGLPQLSGEVSFQRYLQVPQQPLPESFNIFGVFGQALSQDLYDQLSPETQNAVDQFFPPGGNGGDGNQAVSFFLKNNFTAGLNLDAMVFDASYFIGLKAARTFKRYSQQELQTRKREVRNRVVDAYLPVLLIDENLELLDSNILNLEKLRFETSELYKAGFAEQLDIDRLDLSLANLQTERQNLQRRRQVALDNLKFALGMPLEAEVELTEDLKTMVSETPEADLNAEVRPANRPEFGMAELGVQLGELNVKQFQSRYYPSLRAFGAYQQQYQGNDFENGFWAPTAFVGLRLSVPIFDGLLKSAQIQQAKIEKEVASNQLRDLGRAINLEVSSTRTQYLNARRQLDDRQRNLDLAERIYETTRIKYREGVGSSLEVNQAEQSLYTSQSNYLQALYELITAKTDLRQALGKDY